jgi:TP901 family phage tail tape measure protein
MAMSAELGIGPTAAAGGMLELLKAGMDLETVLGGAGQSAIEFSKIAEMDVAASAVVMSDAMNAFGVDATTAANTLSSAADASSTSVAGMAESMAMASAVSALANQSIGDTSAALAILANRGLKGSDAGTSLKSMLLALMAPSEIAAKGLQEIGMSTDSFRDAQGKMLPLVEIIGKFNRATAGLDQAAKDEAMKKIEAHMMKVLDEAGADRIGGATGVAFKSTVNSATVADKEAFRQFVQESDRWELVDLRAAKTAVKEYIDEVADLPPGVNWRTETVVRINRP